MPYVEKVVDCGNVKFVKRYFASRHAKSKQIYRSSSCNKTSFAQERINNKNKIERFSILANANFGESDYIFTLTYAVKNRPDTVETAKKQFTKVMRKIRKHYHNAGLEFKYLWCLEHKKKAYHFHLLCNNDGMNPAIFGKVWEYGKVDTLVMDDREYHSIGEYMMKELWVTTDESDKDPTRCYGSSRNLIRPEPVITILDNDDWSDSPEVEEGYAIVDDIVENGEVEIESIGFTYRFQQYCLRKKGKAELLKELYRLNPYTSFIKKNTRDEILEEIKLLKE